MDQHQKIGRQMLILSDSTSYGRTIAGYSEGEVRRQELTALDVNCSSYIVKVLNDVAANEGMVYWGLWKYLFKSSEKKK